MDKTPVIVIFDVGKTNKKLLLFDEHYKLVHEETRQLPETKDDDDFACENVVGLTQWVTDSFHKILFDEKFLVKAVNVSAYGASFVYIDNDGLVVAPLYNYLKPYSSQLLDKFYKAFGGESLIGKQTASPSLGNLNSGLQLYRMKYEKPETFAKIKFALHLPQYISYILSSKLNSDITSIGCHTYLWNFQEQKYHSWVIKEGIVEKLPVVKGCGEIAGYTHGEITVGVGLHDSSAALIPYLTSFPKPFILLSTGTWCISLNPFNHSRLSDYELHNDCLCYLSYEGKPVKASRLFAGYEHEQQVRKLAEHFDKSANYYTTVKCDFNLLDKIKSAVQPGFKKEQTAMTGQSMFSERKLSEFSSYEQAYHQLIGDIIEQQVRSTNLVLKGTPVKRIFVDGGFSSNTIYMNLLAQAFPGIEVFAASVPQASALGAALVINHHWNNKPLPSNIIKLKLYSVTHSSTI